MVTRFRRSLSLSILNPSSPGRLAKLRPAPEKAYHVRSTSLPCRSHPIISRVEHEIGALRSWQSKPEPESGCSAWLCDGLAHLDHLLAALDDLLHLPQSQNSLCRGRSRTERLLDDFLRLVDAHGTFRSVTMDLKQYHSTAQVAIRTRDDATLASCLRSHRRLEKELGRDAASLRNAARSTLTTTSGSVSNAMEAELAGVLREVSTTAVSALASVFLGISAASAAASAVAACYSSCSSSTRASWMVGALRRLPSSSPRSRMLKEEGGDEVGIWRRMALQSLEGMDKCIGEMESESDRVFRSLVNTRVSLLNILTPSL